MRPAGRIRAGALPDDDYKEQRHPDMEDQDDASQKSAVIRELQIKRRHKKIKSGLLLKLALLFVLGLLVVFRYASITEMGYQVNSAKTTYETLKSDNDRMEVNLTRKVNLTEVSVIASQKLGMQKPQPYQIVRISVEPVDQTELLNVELTKELDETPWYEKLLQQVKSFLGLM